MASAELKDFSLVLGGPLYQLYLRTRLARAPLGLLFRRITVISLFAWLPLLLLCLYGGNGDADLRKTFFMDATTHARFLIAIPLLLGAEVVVLNRLWPLVSQFLERGIVAEEDIPRFWEIIASTVRLRNSKWVEILLLILVFGVGNFLWRHYTSIPSATWYGAPIEGVLHLTPAGYWYAFVSVPIFQFLFFRWYFRIGLWYRLLWKTSGLKLNLIGTHPDRAGGLGFLGLSIYAFFLILLAHSVILAGLIGNHIWFEGQSLLAYRMEILSLLVYLLALVTVPLAFFSRKLWRAKVAGIAQYGTLAMSYARDFKGKWIDGNNPKQDALLGTGDIQSLADMANSYEVVRRMGVFPYYKETILQVGFALILPFAPLLLTMVPLEKVVDKLFQIAF